METKGFFPFEMIIDVLASSFPFIWISKLWVYSHYNYYYSYSAVINIRRQNPPRAVWIKTISAFFRSELLLPFGFVEQNKLYAIQSQKTLTLLSKQLLPSGFAEQWYTHVYIICHISRLQLVQQYCLVQLGQRGQILHLPWFHLLHGLIQRVPLKSILWHGFWKQNTTLIYSYNSELFLHKPWILKVFFTSKSS